jgi:hypothetical protein
MEAVDRNTPAANNIAVDHISDMSALDVHEMIARTIRFALAPHRPGLSMFPP